MLLFQLHAKDITVRPAGSESTDYCLRPHQRIKKRSEFLRLQQAGSKVHTRSVLVIYSPSELPYSRIGVVVSKRVSNRAVKRNRIKRIFKEAFRLNRYKLATSFDIVLIARQNSLNSSFSDVERDIVKAWKRAGLLDTNTEEKSNNG